MGQKSEQNTSVVYSISYTIGQEWGQIASVVDFLTFSVGRKSGQKSSVVEFWIYTLGQKSGQIISTTKSKTHLSQSTLVGLASVGQQLPSYVLKGMQLPIRREKSRILLNVKTAIEVVVHNFQKCHR